MAHRPEITARPDTLYLAVPFLRRRAGLCRRTRRHRSRRGRRHARVNPTRTLEIFLSRHGEHGCSFRPPMSDEQCVRRYYGRERQQESPRRAAVMCRMGSRIMFIQEYHVNVRDELEGHCISATYLRIGEVNNSHRFNALTGPSSDI